ncbi:PKD domain-containing protein [Danxiaibacter flavus]|uniref:PKD domain-containing protein n=1 Tax=Danxiaibacter flavus TaxID=3049108 RepID=A0ABV3ZNY4_9BACT|nr:PKD domain-containing protein [Chitinophagaceae bacterium DXS]
MSIKIQETNVTYATLSDALTALPATFDKDYTIYSTEDINLSSALTIPSKTTGSFKLTIKFDLQTRKLYTDGSQTSVLVLGGVNNFVLDTCTVQSPNYASSTAIACLVNGSCNSISFKNIKFDGCRKAVGNGTSFAGVVVSLTLDGCSFQNCSAGATDIGAGTFTNADYSQPSTAYNYTNVTVKNCQLKDVNNKAVIPSTTYSTDVTLKIFKAYNVTIQDNVLDTTTAKGFDIEHCQNVLVQRNIITKAAWSNTNSNVVLINNSLNVRVQRNAMFGNSATANCLQLNYCKTLFVNNNTIDCDNGQPISATFFLDWRELFNNIFWTRGSYIQLINSTTGLDYVTEFKAADYNYYRVDGSTQSLKVQVGATTGGTTVNIKGNSDTTLTTYRGNGYENHSFFVVSNSATADKAEIFNKGTYPTKPDYCVLPTATSVYQKADATKGGTADVRGWNLQTLRDIGAYDYSATDPNASHNPPQISVSSNRLFGIKSDTTFSFSGTVNYLDSGATITGWSWNFGDGTTSTSQNPTKKYTSLPSSGNTFTVTCTATDSNGQTDTKNLTVTVYNDGVEIIGGFFGGEIYTGASALSSAVTRVSQIALMSNVAIAIKTTTIQNFFYYNNGDSGPYRVNIYTDMTFTSNQKCWVRSQTSENGVWIQGRTNILWENCKFTSATGLGGVRCTNGRSNVFRYCDFMNSQYGVYLTGADGYEFIDCNFQDVTISKVYLNTCSNITFVRCNLVYSGTGTESLNSGTKQHVTIGNCSNIRFLNCNVDGNGSWDCFIKGNQLKDILVDGCTFQSFKQQLFYFINGPAGQYNAERVIIRNNLFKNSMITASRGSTAAFDFTASYDITFQNNTMYEDRAGNGGLRVFNITGGTSKVQANNNLFFIRDSNQVVNSDSYIFKINTAEITTGEKALIADRNYYMFQDGARNKIKWGNVDNVSYKDRASGVGLGLEGANSVQYASDTASTVLINTTTLEPLSGSPLNAMGGSTPLSKYDFDLNVHNANGTVGAKEFTKTAYSLTAASFLVTNLSPKANGLQYTSANASYTIPSLDILNFNNEYAPFVKDFKWELTATGYANTLYSNAFNLSFTDQKTYTVKLTLIKNDNSSLVVTKTGFFVVGMARPIPKFKLSSYRPFVGDKIDFINESQFGTSYEWTITKSGGTSEVITTENIIQKQFSDAGIYDVRLKATNNVDNDFVEYRRTIHVNAAFNTPYLNQQTERNIYYNDEVVNIQQFSKFKKKSDVHRWKLYDSNTGQLVYSNPQNSPTIPAGRLSGGDYDVLFTISNKYGTTEHFKRRAFCVLPIPSTSTRFNKVCTITDRFVDPTNGSSYDGSRVDGTADSIAPGTIISVTGETRRLELTYLKGTAELPIVVVPGQNEFEIKMNSFNGIHLVGCEHVVIAGQLNPGGNPYGFNVHNDTTGISVHASSSCVNAEYLSTYVRVMGCELWNSGFSAMRMKTEPYGNYPQGWRGTGFIQMDTFIHDNLIYDSGGEAMYLGGTQADEASNYYTPSGPDINGNTVSKCFWTALFNTKVYRNRVDSSGWDGIQCGNCFRGTEVHDNIVLNTGVAQVANQSAGMSINNGFVGDIYNNIVDNNIIMQPFKGRTRVFCNTIIKYLGNDAFYIIDDGYVALWDFDKTPTIAPYGGQWDGSTYYDGSATEIQFFNNTLLTNRMAFYFLSKMPSKLMPTIKIYGNLAIYTPLSYKNFDPNVSPQAPATMQQAKLLYKASEVGAFVQDNGVVFQNIVRKLDDIDDLEISNLVKGDASISPGSAALFAMQPDATYASIIAALPGGKLYSQEGLRNADASGKVTVGANTIPSYTGPAWVPTYYNFKGGDTAENDAYLGTANEVTADVEAKVMRLHNGIAQGGVSKTVPAGQTGYFIHGSTKYWVKDGQITGYEGQTPANTVASIPQNFAAIAGTGQVVLTWAASESNGGSAVTGYKLYRGVASGSLNLFKTLGNVFTYTDTEVTNDTKYFYQVVAINGIGDSSRTVEKEATPYTANNASSFLAVPATGAGWDVNYPNQKGWMYTPATYNNGNTNLYPMILNLHGSGEIAASNATPPNGIDKVIAQGLALLIKNGQIMNCLVYSPQINNSSWNSDRPARALAWAMANYRVDPNRIYITGLSLGSQGAWYQRMQNTQLFAAAIMACGSCTPTNSIGYGNARRVPSLWIGGDQDTTQPFYQLGATNTPVAIITAMNNTSSKPKISDKMTIVKGGTHSATVWNDRMYNKATAGFDFEAWFLRHSLIAADTATNYVTWIEGVIVASKWDEALFAVADVQACINDLSAGTVKTNLQSRLNVVTGAIDNQGKRYLVNLGAAGGNYNALASGAAGASVGTLKDNLNSNSGYGLQVVSAGTSGATEYATGNYFADKYFGFSTYILQAGFVVNGVGGQYKFTGLNAAKTYRLIAFGGYDKTDPSNPADLTITVNGTSKYIFTPGNTRDYIEFSGITGVTELLFKAQSSPNVTNGSLITKTATGALQTPATNISSFRACDAYLSAVMLIEQTTMA